MYTHTHTCICVIHKTGIFKEAPGGFGEVLLVTKEVLELLRGSRDSWRGSEDVWKVFKIYFLRWHLKWC